MEATAGSDVRQLQPANYMQAVSGNTGVRGTCGLHNLGNTCYLNSTIQALASVSALREHYVLGVFEKHVSMSPMGLQGRLANGFARLVKDMWCGSYSVLSPADLKSLLAQRWPEFGGHAQQDAQE